MQPENQPQTSGAQAFLFLVMTVAILGGAGWFGWKAVMADLRKNTVENYPGTPEFNAKLKAEIEREATEYEKQVSDATAKAACARRLAGFQSGGFSGGLNSDARETERHSYTVRAGGRACYAKYLAGDPWDETNWSVREAGVY